MSRKKIGLALSGGGARGFSHIGVLKVLDDAGITFDYIAGTSAGSIVGGCLAAGMSVCEIEAMAKEIRWGSVIRPSLPLRSVLTSVPMGKLLDAHLPVKQFHETLIPFSAIAFDLNSNKKVIITSGPLSTAIRASCAVPGIFAPIPDGNGALLVDGGVVSPLPALAVREMGADIVIAIDLLSCGATFRSASRTGFGVMLQAVLALVSAASIAEHNHADIVIEPQIAHLRPDQISRRGEFFELGKLAAAASLDAVKKLVEKTG